MAGVSLGEGGTRPGNGAASDSGPSPIRVLIVNRSALMGNAIACLVASRPGYEVVGIVKCCADCCRGVSDLTADVVICDLDMQEACGDRSLDRFGNCLPDVPTIVLSSDDHEHRILRVVRAGVQGFITKDTAPETLFNAIRAITRGECYLDAGVQSKILGLFGGSRGKLDPSYHLLTDREQRILNMMANGLTNEQISKEICLSKSAVKYHNAAIFKKLRVSRRAEAIKVAIQQALV